MTTKSDESILRGFTRMNWRPWAVVCAVLLVCGGIYWATMSKYRPLMERKIVLSVPLSIFPLTMGDWAGEDRPLTPEVLQIAGNDDYVNRLYADRLTGEWAHFYIAYSGRPRTMVGHRPQVCYVSAGWVHDSTEKSRVVLASGIALPCLVHRFHQPPPNTGDIVVLNY